MLSVSKGMSAGAVESYHGKEDYYTRDTGEWIGKGAEELGLTGAVDKADFKAVAAGLDPRDPDNVLVKGKTETDPETGEVKETRRAANDLTFSAPKSVSVVCAAGETSLKEIHDAAVKAVMSHIEAHYSAARIPDGQGGNQVVQTGNIAAAKFDHMTNRDIDPQMHSHVVVFNLTRTEDGKWRANEPKAIYQDQKELGRLYRNEMITGLQAAGYAVEIKDRNELFFEIKGVAQQTIDHFSTRREAIEAQVASWQANGEHQGKTRAEMYEMAALHTREAKASLTPTEVEKHWQNEFTAAGTSPEEIHEAVQAERVKAEPASPMKTDLPRPENPGQPIEKLSAEQSLQQAIDVIHETQSVFSRARVLDVAAKFDAGNHGVGELNKAFDQLQEKTDIIELGKEGGRVIYSTREMIELEQRNIERVNKLEGSYHSQASHEEVSAFLAKWEKENFVLSDGQRQAVMAELTGTHSVLAVQGDPGTGKTTVAQVAEAFNREVLNPTGRGHHVVGAAYTGKAAQELSETLGRDAFTIDRLLNMEVRAVDPAKYAEITARQQESLSRTFRGDGDGGRQEQTAFSTLGGDGMTLNFAASGQSSGYSVDTGKGMGIKFGADGQAADYSQKAGDFTFRFNSKGEVTGYNVQLAKDHTAFFSAAGKVVSNTVFTKNSYGDTFSQTFYTNGRSRFTNIVNVDGELQYRTNSWVMPDGSRGTEGKYHDKDGNAVSERNILYVPRGHHITIKVDEASFVGAEQTAQLLDLRERLESELGVSVKLEKMGDTKQKQAIAAGKSFGNALEHTNAERVHLKEINRQKNWELLSVARALNTADKTRRQEAAREAVDRLKASGNVTEIKDRNELLKATAEKYFSLAGKRMNYTDQQDQRKTAELKDIIVVTATNKDRQELNNLIREARKQRGELGETREKEILVPSNLSAQKMGLASNYKEGMIVQFTGSRDDNGKLRQYGNIRNGTTWEVKGNNPTKNTITLSRFDAKNGTVVEREFSAHKIRDKIAVYEKQQREFSAGDKIVMLQNDVALGVRNGTRAEIKGFDQNGGIIANVNGKTVNLGEYNKVDHGYAVTTEKSQGATVDAVIHHADVDKGKTSYNSVNVAVTRARYHAEVMTTDADKYREQAGREEVKTDTVQRDGAEKLSKAEMSRAEQDGAERRTIRDEFESPRSEQTRTDDFSRSDKSESSFSHEDNSARTPSHESKSRDREMEL